MNFVRIILLSILSVSLLGCPSKNSEKRPEQSVVMSLSTEPPDLNSMRSTDTVSGQILGHTNEGLTRYNKNLETVGGVAEKWELSDKTATFFLRKNAKWSDGKPVTAHDFVFSWRTVVDPKTASQYAFIFYPIKNAEKINQGKMPTSDLGVEAKDDFTLKVTFEKPCGYFIKLTSFPTYFPVREDFYNAQNGRYAADAKNLISNGPFVITSWVHGASLRLEKNPHYWDKDSIKLEMIDFPYILADPKARFELFKNKKVDLTHLDSDTLQVATRDNFKLHKFSDGSVFFIEFNHRPTNIMRSKNLRLAIRSVYDTKELVEKILALPGNEPAYSLFPSWLKGTTKPFREEFPVKIPKTDYEAAKKYVEAAKKELKLDAIPEVHMIADDTPNSKKQAEYIQSQMHKHLGIKVNIDIQTFKQRLAKMTAGDFDMVMAGWGPDYDDPMTFADLFTSWNENNRGKYSNPAYDKAIQEAMSTMDQKKRMAAMAKVQQIIIDDVTILPMYERGLVYVQNPRLTGVVRQVVGADPNFTYATVK